MTFETGEAQVSLTQCGHAYVIDPTFAWFYSNRTDGKGINLCNEHDLFKEICSYDNSCVFAKKEFRDRSNCTSQSFVKLFYDCVSGN